jgi:hypothetical protein
MLGPAPARQGHRPVLILRTSRETNFHEHAANIRHFAYQMEIAARYEAIQHFREHGFRVSELNATHEQGFRLNDSLSINRFGHWFNPAITAIV